MNKPYKKGLGALGAVRLFLYIIALGAVSILEINGQLMGPQQYGQYGVQYGTGYGAPLPGLLPQDQQNVSMKLMNFPALPTSQEIGTMPYASLREMGAAFFIVWAMVGQQLMQNAVSNPGQVTTPAPQTFWSQQGAGYASLYWAILAAFDLVSKGQDNTPQITEQYRNIFMANAREAIDNGAPQNNPDSIILLQTLGLLKAWIQSLAARLEAVANTSDNSPGAQEYRAALHAYISTFAWGQGGLSGSYSGGLGAPPMGGSGVYSRLLQTFNAARPQQQQAYGTSSFGFGGLGGVQPQLGYGAAAINTQQITAFAGFLKKMLNELYGQINPC